MLEHDPHATDSVDRIIAREMVRLCAATANVLYICFAPLEVAYLRGTRPKLESILAERHAKILTETGERSHTVVASILAHTLAEFVHRA